MAGGDSPKTLLKRLKKVEEAQARLAAIARRISAQAETVAEIIRAAGGVSRPPAPRKRAPARRAATARKAATTRKSAPARKAASARTAAPTRKRATPSASRRSAATAPTVNPPAEAV